MIDKNHNIKYIADFGCGYATILFELAVKYSNIIFFGFDISRVVIEYDILKAKELGLENINFMVARLPEVPTRSYFDVIICTATLHYVLDIKKQ